MFFFNTKSFSPPLPTCFLLSPYNLFFSFILQRIWRCNIEIAIWAGAKLKVGAAQRIPVISCFVPIHRADRGKALSHLLAVKWMWNRCGIGTGRSRRNLRQHEWWFIDTGRCWTRRRRILNICSITNQNAIYQPSTGCGKWTQPKYINKSVYLTNPSPHLRHSVHLHGVPFHSVDWTAEQPLETPSASSTLFVPKLRTNTPTSTYRPIQFQRESRLNIACRYLHEYPVRHDLSIAKFQYSMYSYDWYPNHFDLFIIRITSWLWQSEWL